MANAKNPRQPRSSAAGVGSSKVKKAADRITAAAREQKPEDTKKLFVISVAAEMTGMHAQTLRNYDRLGLVRPTRAPGGGRRYTQTDIEALLEIQRLGQEEGISLNGIKTIIELRRHIQVLEQENRRLEGELEAVRETLRDIKRRRRSGGEIVHVPRSTAVVMWEPRKGPRQQ